MGTQFFIRTNLQADTPARLKLKTFFYTLVIAYSITKAMSTYDKSFGNIPQETIVKFQALWRGYICKRAFPFALAQAKERKQSFIEWENKRREQRERQERREYEHERPYDY